MRPKLRYFNPNTLVLAKNIGIGFLVVSVVVLLMLAIWHGTRLPMVTIGAIEVRGGETVNKMMVEQIIDTTLEGEYVGLIPYRFIWFYPKSEIIESVSKIERVHNIQLVVGKERNLLVTFDEYVPHALWCASVDEDQCAFLDARAYAFALAPQLSGGSFMRFITTGRIPQVGERLIKPERYQQLNYLFTLLSEQQWFVSHAELDQVGDAFLTISGGGEIKVRLDDAPEKIVQNMFLVLQSDEFKHIKPGNFSYIDLRFGNKIFVNEEIVVTETETVGEGEEVEIDETEEWLE